MLLGKITIHWKDTYPLICIAPYESRKNLNTKSHSLSLFLQSFNIDGQILGEHVQIKLIKKLHISDYTETASRDGAASAYSCGRSNFSEEG